MTTLALLTALLAVTAILSGSGAAPPATNNRYPHRIPLQSIRAPAEYARVRDAELKMGTNGVPIVLTLPYLMLVGNISVGSQTQSLPVWFQTQDEEFYFLDVNGTGATTSRYDYTASSTAVVNNQGFWAGDTKQINGNSTVTDTIQFINQPTNLTFGYATAYPQTTADRAIAGAIGLSPVPLQRTNLTTFGAQVASLASPTVSVNYVFSVFNVTDYTITDSGQITMGSEDTDNCIGGYSYTPVDPQGLLMPTGFGIATISGQTPDGTSISLTINANRTAMIYHTSGVTTGSNQFVQLLVNASGLVYQGNSYYEMPSCDDLKNIGDLTMTLSGGATVSLSPYDYIFKNVTSDGTTTCGAILQGGFDESTPYAFMALGQFFLNNHCYAYNYNSGTIGIGAARKKTMFTLLH